MLSLREYKEEYGLFTSICLNVTNDCNLQCRYCFVEQKPEYMTLQVAMDAVDFLYNNLQRKRELENNNDLQGHISYFGGEPMLMYESIIVPLTSYIEEKYPDDFKMGITTNGTLLTKDRIDFLYEHQIMPLLSIDGNKNTQDYNRPCKDCNKSSFEMVNKNIPYLLKKFPNTTFRMTIYEDTCDQLFDNILYAESMGFKYFFCIPDNRHNFSNENFKKLEIELEKLLLYFSGSIIQNVMPIQGNIIEESFLYALKFPAAKKESLQRDIDINVCGLGTVSASIDYKGNIFGCQEQVSNNNKNNIFFIGNIYNKGINKDLHFNLLSQYRGLKSISCENPEKCKDCKFSPLCNQTYCPSMSYQRFKDFSISPITFCNWKNILLKLGQELLNTYDDNIKKYLIQLLKREESGL